MPRGRPRKGLSRMDAAVDAMVKFGFERELVRRHVRHLLEEYGGDIGWPFIEDCSYKELLEAILREQENIVTDENQIEEKTGGEPQDDALLLLDNLENVAADGNQIEEQTGGEPQDVALLDILENVAADGNQIEDKCGGEEELVGPSNNEDDALLLLDRAEPISPDLHPPLMNNDANGWKDIHPNQESTRKEDSRRREDSGRCRQFYGWIDWSEEDVDDDDFVYLPPSSMKLGPPPQRK